jgi:hypothetical protein
MAPLVADMRSATAIDQEASTTKRIKLAALRTRTFRCRSVGWIAKATCLRCLALRFWWGAAARMVASKAMSVVDSVTGRAEM